MPTTARFTGLCIEGRPVAGKFKASDRPTFRVIERQPMPDLYREVDVSAVMNATVNTVDYKHVTGLRWRNENTWTDEMIDFWIPSDQNWSPIECVRRMAEDYANYHDLKNS